MLQKVVAPGVPLPIPANGGKASSKAHASKAKQKPSLPGLLSADLFLRFITFQTPNSSRTVPLQAGLFTLKTLNPLPIASR